MARGLILALGLFVAGCQSVPIDHRYENLKPYDSRLQQQVKKDSVIQILTIDDKNITMKFKSVNEYAVTGDVDGVIDSIPLKKIDAITFNSTTYEFTESFKQAGGGPMTGKDVAAGVGAGVGAAVVCLITVTVFCPSSWR